MSRRDDHDAALAKILLAASISVCGCAHGNVYLRLHDKSGAIFACAVLGRESAVATAGEILDALEGGNAQCAGHA